MTDCDRDAMLWLGPPVVCWHVIQNGKLVLW